MTEEAKPATDGHYSSCAVHNMPAYPAGPCDCGLEDRLRAARRAAEAQPWKPGDPRCNACDNGIANAWTYCAWCGTALKEPANG